MVEVMEEEAAAEVEEGTMAGETWREGRLAATARSGVEDGEPGIGVAEEEAETR